MKQVKRKQPLGLVGGIALLCLLIAAEATAVMHSLDFDAHIGSDPCKICISISSLDDAAAAGSWTFVPPARLARIVDGERIAVVFARTESPTARGPPKVS